jgi:hypothetical protein
MTRHLLDIGERNRNKEAGFRKHLTYLTLKGFCVFCRLNARTFTSAAISFPSFSISSIAKL